MGAVFGGLLEAPLHPSSKRKYQVPQNGLFSLLTAMQALFTKVDGVFFAISGNEQHLHLHHSLHPSLHLPPDRCQAAQFDRLTMLSQASDP